MAKFPKFTFTRRRLAFVVAAAVVALFLAWRMEGWKQEHPPCTPTREVVRDNEGKVIRIENRTCAKEK